jgi:hypothetical protein
MDTTIEVDAVRIDALTVTFPTERGDGSGMSQENIRILPHRGQ